MKFFFKPLLSVLVVAVLLGYSGCGPKGSDPTPIPDVQLAKLSSTWKVNGSGGDVTLDNVSKKGDYNNFTLTITGTPGASSFTYTTSGRPSLSPWPAAGSWKFGSTVETDIIRDVAPKEVQMTYTVTDTGLELTFDYTGAGESARTSKVTGRWVFKLVK